MSNPNHHRHRHSLGHAHDDLDEDDPEENDERYYPPGNPLNGHHHHQPMPPPPVTWLSQSRVTLLAHWQPQALCPPQVDPALGCFGLLARAAEVFRYTLCRMEYWLSPGGVLREWLRLNVRLALLVAVPSALVVPLITLLLAQLSVWVTHLTETTSKIVLFPLSALLILGLVASLVYLAKSLHLPWRTLRRQRPYRYDPEHYYGE